MTQWGKFSRRNYFVHSNLTARDVTYAGHHPNQCFCWGSTKLAQLSGGPFKAIKPTEDLARKENSRRKLSRQRRRKEIFFSYSFLFPTLKTLPKAQLMWLISTFYWEPIFTTQKSILWRSPPSGLPCCVLWYLSWNTVARARQSANVFLTFQTQRLDF